MNELNKILELAGIIVSPDAFDARDKKDDVGVTIDDMQVNDGNDEFSFEMDDDHEDGYDDLGFNVGEKLDKSASAGEWIKDFQKSDDPRFAGDSKEQRKNRALGAYYATQEEGIEEGGSYTAPSGSGIGGNSKQFQQDLARFISIIQEKGLKEPRDIEMYADRIIKKQGINAFDGVHAEYVAKAAMQQMGITEAEEDDFEELGGDDVDDSIIDLPKVDAKGAKPEPDFGKRYDKWYWGGPSDKFKEGIEDEDDGEIVDFEANDQDDDADDIIGIKPKVRGAKPEPDYQKEYDKWYWEGRGDKEFAEADDLSNGYGKEETFDEDDLFPNGFDSPIKSGKGPAGARQGDNPLNWRNSMTVKESISKSLYQELINFKKKG